MRLELATLSRPGGEPALLGVGFEAQGQHYSDRAWQFAVLLWIQVSLYGMSLAEPSSASVSGAAGLLQPHGGLQSGYPCGPEKR